MLGAMDLGVADNGERAGHEQAAQIAVTLFADTAEPVPAPARVLLRYDPDPGREIRPDGARSATSGVPSAGAGHERAHVG